MFRPSEFLIFYCRKMICTICINEFGLVTECYSTRHSKTRMSLCTVMRSAAYYNFMFLWLHGKRPFEHLEHGINEMGFTCACRKFIENHTFVRVTKIYDGKIFYNIDYTVR